MEEFYDGLERICTDAIYLTPGGPIFLVNVPAGQWHTVRAQESGSVLLECKDGKYELVVYRHSPAVATMEGMRFKEHEFELHPGDSLFVYTDGVAEATDAHNELYGSDRMIEALNKNPDALPREILATVKSSVDEFVGDAPQFDDITMLAIKYFGPEG